MQPETLVHEIGGRRYVPVDASQHTLEHELYMIAETRAAGIEFLAKTGETVDPVELFLTIYQSGRLFTLLAGLLTEEGTTWSREADGETSRATAARATRLRLATGEADRAALRHVLVEYLAEFFDAVAVSSSASPISSSGETATTTSDPGVRSTPDTASGPTPSSPSPSPTAPASD